MKINREILKKEYLNGIWILIFILIFCATGCNNRQASNDNQEQKATQIITDCTGREVEVPINPERIACLCPESGYALALYGQGDKIVATTGGMQRDLLLVEMYPHIKGLPIPKSSEVINVEELLSTNADLVFVKGNTTSNQAEMDKLNKVKIPAVALQYDSMAEQQYAMQMIAKIIGCEAEGQKYQDFYQETVEQVKERVAMVPDDERVSIYHSVSEATRTDTDGSLADDWTKAAGVINVSTHQELKFTDGNNYASMEQILMWDPDYILVNDPNVQGYIMEHEHWAPLQAVKNKRVLPLPNGISRWGHDSSLETPLAVLWTAKLAYPELFNDWDMVKTTRDFYEEFFDWQLDDTEIEKILNGKGMREGKS
ncbi:MAG TPA: ABC transporter substrate-binding protein [Syntrophomonadaceae bacterium]|nr:ABC transporter substrate-binding protein [Syntrophomonadaceae bacterium]HPR93555.1 ABC transporter substrate-binding protein [Syntrophomonadaceae bacterium]